MFLVNISELGRALVTVDLYPARDFCFKIAGLVRLITYSANHRLRSIGREILPKYQQNRYTKTKQEEEFTEIITIRLSFAFPVKF